MTSLTEHDRHGAPYTVPRRLDYALAREIATSAHPARVLAVTSVYRYGRFTVESDCTVTVVMMGNTIARFTETAVYLFTCGYRTASTVEAFNSLISGGWFYTDRKVLYFERYGARQPPEYKPARETFTEGQAFAYPADEE